MHMNTRLKNIKSKPLQFFLLKLVTLLLVLFVLDFALGTILEKLYFKQRNGELYRITYSIDKTHEDILVFGSSRAEHHYHPEVFQKRLNLSFFNTGLDGEHILFHYALLKGALSHYTPKVVILDFVAGEFKINRECYDKISNLLPYYESHPEIRDLIQLRGPYEKYKLLSKVYPYNSEILQILQGVSSSSKPSHQEEDGYFPLYNKETDRERKISYPASYPIDSIKLKIYESFLRDCKKAGTELFVICSPYYLDAQNEEYSIRLAKELARKYNVDFLDFSMDPLLSKNKNLFSDPSHLNDQGARIYTGMVIDSISRKADGSTVRLALR
jgi:hypothetical protein